MSFAFLQQSFIDILLILIMIFQIRISFFGKKENSISKKTIIPEQKVRSEIRIVRDKANLVKITEARVVKFYENLLTNCTDQLLDKGFDMEDPNNPLLVSPIIKSNIEKLRNAAEQSTYRSYERRHIDSVDRILEEMYQN